VGDWESGAIAWTAHRNGVPVLILRGVSDVVGPTGDVTYGSMESFEAGTRKVLGRLLALLERAVPSWYGYARTVIACSGESETQRMQATQAASVSTRACFPPWKATLRRTRSGRDGSTGAIMKTPDGQIRTHRPEPSHRSASIDTFGMGRFSQGAVKTVCG